MSSGRLDKYRHAPLNTALPSHRKALTYHMIRATSRRGVSAGRHSGVRRRGRDRMGVGGADAFVGLMDATSMLARWSRRATAERPLQVRFSSAELVAQYSLASGEHRLHLSRFAGLPMPWRRPDRTTGRIGRPQTRPRRSGNRVCAAVMIPVAFRPRGTWRRVQSDRDRRAPSGSSAGGGRALPTSSAVPRLSRTCRHPPRWQAAAVSC
jgi:hypothetical protein